MSAIRGENEEAVGQIYLSLDGLTRTVSRIEHILLGGNGSEFGFNVGVVGTVNALQRTVEVMQSEDHAAIKRIETLEGRWSRVRWTAAGIGIGAGVASGGVIVTVLTILGKVLSG